MAGTVYFAVTGHNHDWTHVKIGWTGGSPEKRIRDLQTGCPTPLDLFSTMTGSQADERQLHARFADLCVGGEWFLFEGELMRWLHQREGFGAYYRPQLVAAND